MGVSLCLLVLDVPPPPRCDPTCRWGRACPPARAHACGTSPPGVTRGPTPPRPSPAVAWCHPPGHSAFWVKKRWKRGRMWGDLGRGACPERRRLSPASPVPLVSVPPVAPSPVSCPWCPPCPRCPRCPLPPPAAAVSPGRWGQARPRPGLILPTGPGPAVPEVLPPCPGDVGRGGDPGCHSSCPPPPLSPASPQAVDTRGRDFAVSAPGGGGRGTQSTQSLPSLCVPGQWQRHVRPGALTPPPATSPSPIGRDGRTEGRTEGRPWGTPLAGAEGG